MIAPIPDRPEAAAVACEGLAAGLERGETPTAACVQHVTDLLCWLPLTHSLRCVEREGRLVDDVLEVVAKIRVAGAISAQDLRDFAAALRAGRDAMLATGWTRTLTGRP